MPAKPVEIGALKFPGQKAALDYFRQMLYRHRAGTRIPEPDASELAELLKRHHTYDEKVGCGISHFIVRKNPDWPTKGFWIVRTDGTEVDFTFQCCVTGRWD
jgi:hypothetical protein